MKLFRVDFEEYTVRSVEVKAKDADKAIMAAGKKYDIDPAEVIAIRKIK